MVLILLISFLLLSCSYQPYFVRFESPESVRFPVRVLKIFDGDTILVKISDAVPPDLSSVLTNSNQIYSIRFLGIDAMETHDNDRMERTLSRFYKNGVYPTKSEMLELGEMGRSNLSSLIRPEEIIEVECFSGRPLDAYGRILGYLWKGTTNINFYQVKEGFAAAYFPEASRNEAMRNYRKAFIDAEKSAQEKKLGIWGKL